MLTANYLVKAMRLESMFGRDDGACFGVLDSSGLRKKFNLGKVQNKFKKGKKEDYFNFNRKTGGFEKVYTLIDAELSNGYKAKILHAFYGTKLQKKEFLKNKISFSDLENRTIGYIIKKIIKN